MSLKESLISRREVLGSVAATAVTVAAGAAMASECTQSTVPTLPANTDPAVLAGQESYWADVGRQYDRTDGIVNLEHGYWGKMSRPVQDAYVNATRMVNAQKSFYGRKQYPADSAESVRRVAAALGVHDDEIVLTRNASEAIQNVIRQYRGLSSRDSILYADIDYPEFKKTMSRLGQGKAARAIQLEIPAYTNQ